MSTETSLTCSRAKCGETASLKNFLELLETLRMPFFTLNIIPTKLFVIGGCCNVYR